MSYDVDENQIRAHYKLLRHEGFHSVVHCQNPNVGKGFVARKVVFGVEAVIKFAKTYNGKGNVFIGRNPRNADGSPSRISGICCDVDPIREGGAATVEQAKGAVEIGRSILRSRPGGSLLFTGNGCQVFYCWEPKEITPDFAAKTKEWASQFQKEIKPGYELDSSVYDVPRLVKLSGTTSTKGAPASWRGTRFISSVDGGLESDPVMVPSEDVYSEILAVRGVDSPKSEPIGVSDSLRTSVGRPFEADVKAACVALERLSPKRGDDYNDWLRVGMCLHSLGVAGLGLWDNWSRRRRNYKTGECASKWETFGRYSGSELLTLGSLVKWAEEDNAPTGETQISRRLTTARYIEELPARMKAEPTTLELPTGLPGLDAFGPLLVRGHLLTIGARTNTGKTALALNIARSVANAGKKVLMFSTEAGADETMDRFLTIAAGESPSDRVSAAGALLPSLHLDVADAFQPSVEDIRLTAEEDVPDVLIFDHIQHVGRGGDHRTIELATFIRAIHDVCRRLKCAGVVCSQLNRVAASDEPQLHHLKECGTIEEESRAALLMWCMKDDPASDVAPIAAKLAKNKGRMGITQLALHRPSGRFS